MSKILTFGTYLKKRFGEPVRKVPISLTGFTCPNIDGKVTKGGCTYCDNESFSPNISSEESKFFLSDFNEENPLLAQQLKEVDTQFKETSEYFKKRDGVKKFIAYFQSFSNTYAPLDTLKKLYNKAMEKDEVVGISIGTRADCISDELLDHLVELNKTKEIWVEFGVQSVFDKTLKAINRGEEYDEIKQTILKTKSRGLKVCAHLIYGLPKEQKKEMIDSFKEVVSLGVDSIKIHPLYVVANTPLANSYTKGYFSPIEESIYIEAVAESLKKLPENISIQRITAGIDNETLLAPNWCRDKNIQINKIRDLLRKDGFIY